MNIHEMTAFEIQKGIVKRQFSAKEVVTAFFERIYEKERLIDGFLTLCREEAMVQAEQIDKKIQRKERIGRLGGIPVAIKDNICTDGIRTTCASKMLHDFIPPYDATAVRKLKEADAIIIGKTKMDEFAMGSSAEGSAAVVSEGMTPIALGSDTGGSIRQSAAFCGVVGLKPTYGLVSRFGLIAAASSLDQIGPIAGNIKDCAMTLEAIQGEDRLDSTSVRHCITEDYMSTVENGIKGMKIAVPIELFNISIKVSMEKLKEMGASVEDISLPITKEALSAHYIISSAEAGSNLGRFDGIRYGYRTEDFGSIEELIERSRSEGFGEEVKKRIMLGTLVLSSKYYDAYYNRAQKLRGKIKEQFLKVFEDYDLILSPVSPLSDIYTVSANLTGVPALSMPCGVSRSGLPIGLRIMGPHYGEDKIFIAAYALEQELKLAAMHPML